MYVYVCLYICLCVSLCIFTYLSDALQRDAQVGSQVGFNVLVRPAGCFAEVLGGQLFIRTLLSLFGCISLFLCLEASLSLYHLSLRIGETPGRCLGRPRVHVAAGGRCHRSGRQRRGELQRDRQLVCDAGVPCSLSHSRTFSLSLSLSHFLTLALAHSLSLTLTLSLSLSRALASSLAAIDLGGNVVVSFNATVNASVPQVRPSGPLSHSRTFLLSLVLSHSFVLALSLSLSVSVSVSL